MSILTIDAHGARYHINDPGGLVAEPLRAGHPYEVKVLEYIFALKLEGVVLDIGASIGNHSLWFARVCGLHVVAVEPLEVERLRENIQLNDLSGEIEVWPFGLGDTESSRGDAGKGMLRGEGPIPVKCLDNLEPPRPVTLIKIDVEGMEAEVLRGGECLIRQDKPLIFAEAWDGAKHAEVADILEPLGYTHRRTFGATPLEEWLPSR